MKRVTLLYILFGCILLLTGCGPSYTWGYASSIHPRATTAYIHAVMAKEAGDYQSALDYYNEALRYTNSDSVRAERDEVKELAKK